MGNKGNKGIGKRTVRWRIAPVSITFFVLFLVVGVTGCTSNDAPDCLQDAGELKRHEVEVAPFDRITVFELLNLVLIQGEEQKVEIESGEFLLNDISAQVEGDRLVLRNANSCNLFRQYGLSTVYVTSPNITEVRSSTGLLVSSQGALDYPNLNLLSESFSDPDLETTSGSFDVEMGGGTLGVVTNGIAFFELSGTVERLNVSIAAGDSRIEATDLVAQAVTVRHRGTNDVLVNPQGSISGTIEGYGDVICPTRPMEVNVAETFEGRLIFRE